MRTASFETGIGWAMPVLIAMVFILLTSLINEPARKKFMAILLGGAGAAYMSGGGFGLWEMVFCGVVTVCAYNGLRSYTFIGAGWVLHTILDVLHHLYGNPILPFDMTSSLGCAICDPVLAVWCFAGAQPIWDVLRGRRVRASLVS